MGSPRRNLAGDAAPPACTRASSGRRGESRDAYARGERGPRRGPGGEAQYPQQGRHLHRVLQEANWGATAHSYRRKVQSGRTTRCLEHARPSRPSRPERLAGYRRSARSSGHAGWWRRSAGTPGRNGAGGDSRTSRPGRTSGPGRSTRSIGRSAHYWDGGPLRRQRPAQHCGECKRHVPRGHGGSRWRCARDD
jgi:hypothetical protein